MSRKPSRSYDVGQVFNSPDSPIHSVVPGLDLGNYHVERLIGEGGMGAVYAGRHRTLRKTVAIKTLHPHLAVDAGLRARFQREAQAAASINHPNVVEVFDVGEYGKQPFLVMEYLEGRSLRAYLGLDDPLREAQIADFMVPVLAAVAAAHDQHIVHRDLKTDNIFITETPAGLVPKVLDFGISKVMLPKDSSNLTDTSVFLGTPSYMAPEQTVSSKAASAKSDQFSLGVVLYELATGKKPFSGDSLLSLLEAIRSCRFDLPHRHCPQLSGQLEGVILRAMQEDPDDRYGDLKEMGAALLSLGSKRVQQMYTHELQGVGSVTLLSVQGTRTHSGGVTPRHDGTLAASASPGPPRVQPRRNQGKHLWVPSLGLATFLMLWGLSGWGTARKGRAEPAPPPPTALHSPRMPPLQAPIPPLLPEALGPDENDENRAMEQGEAPPHESAPTAFVVRSIPRTEVVGVDGVLGITPLTLQLPQDGDELNLVLRAPGYSPRRVRVGGDHPPSPFPIVLRPVSREREALELELAPR